MADRGLFGDVTESSLSGFLLFIVLVWVAVSLGIVLAGLFPQLPRAVRSIMAPNQSRPAVDEAVG